MAGMQHYRSTTTTETMWLGTAATPGTVGASAATPLGKPVSTAPELWQPLAGGNDFMCPTTLSNAAVAPVEGNEKVPHSRGMSGMPRQTAQDQSRLIIAMDDMEQAIINCIGQQCSSLAITLERSFKRTTKECFTDLEEMINERVRSMDGRVAAAEAKGNGLKTAEAAKYVEQPVSCGEKEEEIFEEEEEMQADSLSRQHSPEMIEMVGPAPKDQRPRNDESDEHHIALVHDQGAMIPRPNSRDKGSATPDKSQGVSEAVLQSQNWYEQSFVRIATRRSTLYEILEYSGLHGINVFFARTLPTEAPKNFLAKLSQNGAFRGLTMFVIVLNAAWLGYESNAKIQNALSGEPNWGGFRVVNQFFTWFFVVELILRLLGNRIWFFVSPNWKWNVFDFWLVVTVIITDMLEGVNLNFIRTLRVFRIIRVARVIRVLKAFRALRKMMFAIMASLESLAWCFLFLTLLMFMFSVFFLQGFIEKLEKEPQSVLYKLEVQKWYGDMWASMWSLLVGLTGGFDWVEIRRPLESLGFMYAGAFPFFIVFVNVGVLNVLTGVFMESAIEAADRDLIVQGENAKVDSFISEMLDLFTEFDVEGGGTINWNQFNDYLAHPAVQAYLAAHNLETSHADMLFKLLDHDNTGDISTDEFVLGLIRLRGEAKTVDVRLVLAALSKVLVSLKDVDKEISSLRREQSTQMTAV